MSAAIITAIVTAITAIAIAPISKVVMSVIEVDGFVVVVVVVMLKCVHEPVFLENAGTD